MNPDPALPAVATAVPLTLIGAVALSAAVVDHRSGRIPNRLVLTGLAIVAGSWVLVAVVDDRLMAPLARDMLAGLLLGGAPVVFLVWLVAPRLIGGGDWKLLAVLGAATGSLAPSAASVIPMWAFGSALVVAGLRRERQIRLGPFLATGYCAALGLVAAQPQLFGVSSLTRGAL